MQYSFEPMLEAIFEAAHKGEGVRVKDEHACLTLSFKGEDGIQALYDDIAGFLGDHADPTEGCLQLVSGRVDVDAQTADIKVRSAFAQHAYVASDFQTQILEDSYTVLVGKPRFQRDCIGAGVTAVTTPRQSRYKFKGLTAE